VPTRNFLSSEEDNLFCQAKAKENCLKFFRFFLSFSILKLLIWVNLRLKRRSLTGRLELKQIILLCKADWAWVELKSKKKQIEDVSLLESKLMVRFFFNILRPRSGLNFINFLCTAFMPIDTKSVKRYWPLDWLLCFWELCT